MVHCVKSVQIRNFFLSVFSCIWTEFLNIEEQLLAPFLESLWHLAYIQILYISPYISEGKHL